MHHPDVYIGSIQPYEGGRPSAIAKRQVDGAIRLTPLGLEGDEQAEKSYHGGPDRALCHYPREHYAHWREQFPAQAEQFCAPAFGENISTEGLTEHNVFMGDIFRWGEALIQVTQPRSPCFKLNYHFAIEDISVLMQQSGRCGWLYRVVSPGAVSGESAGAGGAQQRCVGGRSHRHRLAHAVRCGTVSPPVGGGRPLRQLEQDHAHSARRRAP